MKSNAPAACLLAAALAGCSPKAPATILPPHRGVVFAQPDGMARVEVVREEAPGQPGKVRVVAYFLDEQLKPLAPPPTAASFKPKAARGTPPFELTPTGQADPAGASGLASPPIADDAEVVGELSATSAGKSTSIPINVR